jgi:leucyl aminopeptidase
LILQPLPAHVWWRLEQMLQAYFQITEIFVKELKQLRLTWEKKCGELPLEKDYKELNKSEVADIANIPNTRYGGTITAALFLEEFCSESSHGHI